jgi:translation initiation factor IF-3
MKQIRLVALTSLVIATLVVPSAKALTEAEVASIKKTVANVPVPEWAATAADLVKQAPAADKEAVATTAVRTIVTKSAAVAATVVASIAAVEPEVAPAAAAAAAELAPDQAEKIAKAAALAAPKVADKIAAAVAKTNKRHAARIARAVMSALPKSATQIADAVIAVVPESKSSVQAFSQLFAGGPATGGNVSQSGTPITRESFPGEAPAAAGPITPGFDYGRP